MIDAYDREWSLGWALGAALYWTGCVLVWCGPRWAGISCVVFNVGLAALATYARHRHAPPAQPDERGG